MAKFQVQTEDGIFEVETEDQPSTSSLPGFVKEHINPTKFPAISGLEDLGEKVKSAAANSFRNIAMKPSVDMLPPSMRLPAEAARQVGSMFGENAIKAAPFTPGEFAMTLGAELAPGAMFTRNQILPKYGKALMEDVVPSGAKNIKAAERVGIKTASELTMDRPKLGNSRIDILNNSRSGISDLEDQIQNKLSEISKKATRGAEEVKINGRPLLPAPKSPEIVSPAAGVGGSKDIYRYSEPRVGTIQSYNPEDLNLQTQGKLFTKGNSRGLVNPEPVGPGTEAEKQSQYIRQARRESAQMIGMKLPPKPEYGFKVPNDLAIGKDEFIEVFDKEISKQSRIPTAQREVRALKKLKMEYEKSAPDVADVDYWNSVKRDIYERLGDNAYVTNITSAQKRLEKNFASSIAKKISDRVPGLKDLNKEQGNLLEIRDALIESSPREARDVNPWRPVIENATIRGSRFLTKKRNAPVGVGLGVAPFLNGSNRE